MSDPSTRFTTIFELGAVHFSVDGRGVGHANFGQGSSIVSREALRQMLAETIRDAAEALVTLANWKLEPEAASQGMPERCPDCNGSTKTYDSLDDGRHCRRCGMWLCD